MISIFIFSDSQNLEQFYRTINLIFHLLSSIDTASQDDTFSCDILHLRAIPMLKYRPVKKIDWARS